MELSIVPSLLLLEEHHLLERKTLLISIPATSEVSVPADDRVGARPQPFGQQLLLLEEYYLLRRKRILWSAPIPRRWWTRPIWQNRKEESEFYTVMPLLMSGDPEYFKKYYKMTPEKFEELHSLLEEQLTKHYVVREPLPSRARLAITLRYLASGMYMQDVALEFRVGISTVSATVHYTCRLLWATLQPLYLEVATTKKWEQVAKGFREKCNFPNCVGAVDGKHVQIQAPPHSGSLYYNYKGTYSIVLMAVADSNLRYVMVDVGAYGRQSDGGTLGVSRFGKCLERGRLGLPGPEHLPGTQTAAPHVFVGDEAFRLRPNFLRPYSGRSQSEEKRIFNYRLSRARRCVENTFGVMVSRFRIFRRAINLLPRNVDYVVLACCVLHNFLRDDEIYMSVTADEPRDTAAANGQMCADGGSNMLDLQPPSGHNYSRTAAETRDLFCSYFSSACGAVPWQRAYAGLRD